MLDKIKKETENNHNRELDLSFSIRLIKENESKTLIF